MTAITLAEAVAAKTLHGATVPDKYVVPIKPLQSAPIIDGRFEEEAWTGVTTLGDFVQLDPKEGQPASEKTVVMLGTDEHNIYFAIHCLDEHPDECVAKQMSRDGDLSYDDSVQIILDTYHDRKNGFVFAVNPLGAKIDGLVRNEGEEVKLDWDGAWHCATARGADGWTVEIAIPFSTLRFPATEPQTWGMNIMRFLPREGERSFWRPISRSDGTAVSPFKISRFGEITGLQNMKSGKRYLLTPYMISGVDSRTDRERDLSADGGLDLKVNMASNLVADLTYRLDFAEAEADLQELNLNRYPLYYPEKRSFFTEGADLFYFGDRVEPFTLGEREKFIFFFSRRIGLTDDARYKIPVLGGAKVTGKIGGLGLGFLNLTADDTTILPSNAAQEIDIPQTNYTVLRLKKDLYAESTLGLIALNKESSGDDYNRGLGIDGDFALGKHVKIGGFLAKTYSPDLHGEDHAGAVDLVLQNRLLRSRNLYTEVGENFNPEIGFLTRSDIRKFHSNNIMSARPKFWGLHKLNAIYDLNYVTDRSGRLQTQISIYELAFVFKNGSGIALLLYDNLEVLDDDFVIRLDSQHSPVIPAGSYRFRNFFVGVATDYSKPLGATLWLDRGGYYNGTRSRVLLAPRWRPREGVQATLAFDLQELDFPDGRYTTVISTGSLDLTLKHGISLKTLLQWTRDDTFDANVIFNWNFIPDANLFLVYNGTRDAGDQVVQDRSLVAKMSYSFRR